MEFKSKLMQQIQKLWEASEDNEVAGDIAVLSIETLPILVEALEWAHERTHSPYEDIGPDGLPFKLKSCLTTCPANRALALVQQKVKTAYENVKVG